MVDIDKDPRSKWAMFRHLVETGQMPEDNMGGTSQYVVYDRDACATCQEFFEDTGRGGHAVRQAPDKRLHHALFDVDGELIQECCVKCARWIDTKRTAQNRPDPV